MKQLAAEILHEAASRLPGWYVFDVVTSNFTALDRASRSDYRLVCVAEESSAGSHHPNSTLDGRKAAGILRSVRNGLCSPLVCQVVASIYPLFWTLAMYA